MVKSLRDGQIEELAVRPCAARATSLKSLGRQSGANGKSHKAPQAAKAANGKAFLAAMRPAVQARGVA